MVINSSNCICEGYKQVYECRVTGVTLWTGTAFVCDSSSNELILLQSISGTKVCNNGAIFGQIIRVENDTYVSQLTVSIGAETVTNSMNISCFRENGSSTTLIGSSLLTITTGNIRLAYIMTNP